MLLQNEALRQICVSQDDDFSIALKCLDATAYGICLVVDASLHLLGTITDGDIRRRLLCHGNINATCIEIANTSPFTISAFNQAINHNDLCSTRGIRHLPLITDDGRISALYIQSSKSFSDDLLTLVIMAGGKGTRLQPLTENCPKPLIDVGGKPIIDHLICKAVSEGITNILISVNYLKNMIIDYLGDGSRFGCKIHYIEEKTPLGTAGALAELDLDSPFIVTNGDVLCGVSYRDIYDYHRSNSAMATMATKIYEHTCPYGVVDVSGINIVSFQEKPTYRNFVNAGIYVLDQAALRYLISGEYCDMPILFERIREDSQLTVVYPIHEGWIDIGEFPQLTKARNSFSSNNP